MMTGEKFTQYLNGRYAEMLAYYDKRAVQNKWAYRLFSWYIIVTSGFLAPLMAIKAFKESLWPPFLTASVAAAAAMLAYSKFHENWLRYRATWDCLKRELQLHAAGIGSYQGAADPNALFVSQVEALISAEGKEWFAKHACADGAKQGQSASGRNKRL
jgi:conflict system pore-forming effector with SLATT domain